MISFNALKTRFLSDTAFDGDGATPVIAKCLERIGWRAVRDPSPEELAAHLLMLFEGCVHEHRDVSALTLAIEAALRDAGPLLDGGLPPVEAYAPAAEELLRLYVDDLA